MKPNAGSNAGTLSSEVVHTKGVVTSRAIALSCSEPDRRAASRPATCWKE